MGLILLDRHGVLVVVMHRDVWGGKMNFQFTNFLILVQKAQGFCHKSPNYFERQVHVSNCINPATTTGFLGRVIPFAMAKTSCRP